MRDAIAMLIAFLSYLRLHVGAVSGCTAGAPARAGSCCSATLPRNREIQVGGQTPEQSEKDCCGHGVWRNLKHTKSGDCAVDSVLTFLVHCMSTHYYRGPIKQQPTSYVNDALTDEEFSQILQLQEIQAHEEALRQPREDTTDDEMLAKMLHKQLNRPSDASRTQAKKEEEYLTQKFLKEEAQERQRKLDTKEYPCDICFGDVLVSDLYIIDAW